MNGRKPAAARRLPPLRGIGIDIVDLERAERFVRSHREGLSRFLSPAELRLVRDSASPAAAFALVFASKEAASKAMGVRVQSPGQLRDYRVSLRRGRLSVAARGSRARFDLTRFDAPGCVGVLAFARGGAVR